MRGFLGLTKRNMLIYFKDVQSVVFSMLTSIIVLVLYLLFLKSSFVDAINGAANGLTDLIEAADLDMLANGLLLTGVISSALITVPYNTLITIIRDKENKIDYDISATPLKRVQIIMSYFVASLLSAFIMASIILTCGLVILSRYGSLYLETQDIIKLYGITFLGALSSTAIFMIVMLFFKTSAASGSFFGLLSAACGFVIGAYIPISDFSENVQTFCNLFPASGVTVLYRNVILNPLLRNINSSIGGVDDGMFVDSLKEAFVFKPVVFGDVIELPSVVAYIVIVMIVSIAAIAIIYPRIYKRK